MKRRIMAVVVAAALCALACGLCGCQVLASSSTYTPETKKPTVTAPALGKEGVLRVGVNSNNAPFSASVSGKLVGIDVDIAAAIATQMGLKLELIDVGNGAQAALQDGTVDIIMNMDSSDTSTKAWVSGVYLPSAVVLFAHSPDAGMPVADSTTVIEAQSSSRSAWEVSNQFSAATVKSTVDLKSAFSDLDAGTVNYVASDAIIGRYAVHTSGSGAVIVGSLQKIGGYSVGVAASNEKLKKAVSEAIDAARASGVVDIIQAKWLGEALDLDNVNLSVAAQKATNAGATTPPDTSVNIGSSQTGKSSSAGSASQGSEKKATLPAEKSSSRSAA